MSKLPEATPNIQILLESPRHSGVLFALARFFRLDVYGDWLMTPRASMDLGFGAFMLTIVCLFETASWTAVFNLVLHTGMMTISGLTLVAAGIGIVFALAVFVLERQIFTADLTGIGSKLGIVVRIAVIVRCLGREQQ